MAQFPVLEIFGPTIQGEGMVAGRKTMFIRTAGCDYSCSWCDSAFTWDGSAKDDIEMLSSETIIERLEALGGDQFNHVTVSGGNPALLKHLDELIEQLHKRGIQVALETQGSRWQPWFGKLDDLTISPKPPSSNMQTNWETLDTIIDNLIEQERLHHISLKVVIFNDGDFSYAEQVHKRYPQVPFYLQVGNDDLTETDDSQLALKLLSQYEWLINKTLASATLNSARVLPQLHALIWGNKRGV
ncbi:7-carboxy-7-deazaguanine synthase [Amphibacillus marinus]|uniref:7-carboxy-7-deazaguanine synthase n=1 Tax=Amphibacillus marinus TaxID=872970 RepID=A0A1H8H7Y4_9BACI|nr:7-carboxy-7-deazaguanine synthase QueE [Amphibacillus marinus]SEN52140.1 7-carboxy-7-deazaguanine synthase [Amphibacillus marinus]